jgi:hypothetical protein
MHTGYQSATAAESPKFQGTTFGNIIAGDLVGVIVDAASGANFEYPSDVKITMAPNPATILPPVASLPAVGVSYKP